MKYVECNELKPNMIIANTLYDNNENILLRANKKLTITTLNRIKKLNYDGIYIFEDDDVVSTPLVSEEVRLKSIKNLKNVNLDECLYLANSIVEEIRSNGNLLVETISLSSYDNYTYVHSVNVCILSILIGIGLGFTDEKLEKLSQAALLHDIGKTRIPLEILNKPGKLTDEEFEEIKKHSEYGYELLKNNENISSVVRVSVLQHHINEDEKSGYPLYLLGNHLHQFAKIIHIADVYDALTSKRVYKDAMNPADALEYLMANVGTMFNLDIVKTFMKYIALYPIGTKVLLSNNEVATIYKNNLECLARPIVKIQNGKIIDLYKNLNLTIVKSLT